MTRSAVSEHLRPTPDFVPDVCSKCGIRSATIFFAWLVSGIDEAFICTDGNEHESTNFPD